MEKGKFFDNGMGTTDDAASVVPRERKGGESVEICKGMEKKRTTESKGCAGEMEQTSWWQYTRKKSP